MYYIEYERLSSLEKSYYQNILQQLSAYKTSVVLHNSNKDGVLKAYEAVLCDHPELFWVKNGYNCRIETIGSNNTITITPKLVYSDIGTVYGMKQRLDSVVDSIVINARRKYSQYEQMLYVHDYIVESTEYVLNTGYPYNAYACLINRKAVCAGYAAAYQMIMQRLGIVCGRVYGTKISSYATEPDHEWNYVLLDGEFYFIDVTWDDPTVENGRAIAGISHDYFCLSTSELLRTHRITGGQYVPDCLNTRYNYFIYNGYYLDTYSLWAVEQIIRKQLLKGDKIQIKFGSSYESDRAVADLIKGNKIFNILTAKNQIGYSISKSGLILTIR